MARKSFFKSFIAVVLIALISFFVIYFFMPTFAEGVLGISYRQSRDTQRIESNEDLQKMEAALIKGLKEAGATEKEIADFIAHINTSGFQEKLTDAVAEGKDAMVNLYEEAATSLGMVSSKVKSFSSSLGDAISSINIGEFTKKQIESLSRYLEKNF